MWQPIEMPSGRWFVVRYSRGKTTTKREFLKHGAASLPFETEAQATARAGALNGAEQARDPVGPADLSEARP